jgi:two-component system LytT family response regulator
MEKIRSIIVDDEPGNIITLNGLLKKYCPEIEVVGEAENIRQAEQLIRKEMPGLVFLDIEMPYGNAFDLLEKMRPVEFNVIFVTAFENYAVKAFKHAAVDYILKPVNIQELQAAVAKATKKLYADSVNARIELLLSNLAGNNSSNPKIALPTPEGLQFETIDEIIFFEANANYTYVHIGNNSKYIVSKTLGEVESILPVAVFCRIHHSFIINMKHIKKYYKGRGGYVVMDDGTTIEVSVRRKEAFLQRFRFKE